MRYCKKCILPDTRPRLPFNEEGVCGACIAYEQRKSVDWKERARLWDHLVTWAKARRQPYDAMLPISGGKDSFAQAVKCLESGLHVLGYTWRPVIRTALGQENLETLIGLGMDHYELTINPRVEKKLYVQSFEKYGSDACMHAAVYYSSMAMAYRFETPLVIWSENSADVYSGGEWANRDGGARLSQNWMLVHGSTAGATAADWISTEVSKEDVTPYWCPSNLEMGSKGVNPIFLGFFFDWDPVRNYEVAAAHGFKAASEPMVGIYNFADLDDPIAVIHHFLKIPKFALMREMDNLSLEIRAGRITRDEALWALKDRGLRVPYAEIAEFCEFVEKEQAWFWDIVRKFRNSTIWRYKFVSENKAQWTVPDFLIEDWDWGLLAAAMWSNEIDIVEP